ncbi:MAG: hypothetical protein PVH47_05190, partial [Thiohalocapsa sp.]
RVLSRRRLLAFLAKIGTEPENAVSRFLHFQRLGSLEMAGHPAPRGKRRFIGASLTRFRSNLVPADLS